MPAHSYSAKPIQIIEGQYLDQRKLMSLLRNVYGTSDGGKNNFRVELRLNRYRIYPSEHVSAASELTQDQILNCRRI